MNDGPPEGARAAEEAELASARAALASEPAPGLAQGAPAKIAAKARACAVLAQAEILPSGRALADLLGTGQRTARAYGRLAQLEPALIAAVERGEIGGQTAAAIAGLESPEERIVLATLAAGQGWGATGDDGVRTIVAMVRKGRSLADALRTRHGIDIEKPGPWAAVLMLSWRERAVLQRRAWLGNTDPTGMLARDAKGKTQVENETLRKKLKQIEEIARMENSGENGAQNGKRGR